MADSGSSFDWGSFGASSGSAAIKSGGSVLGSWLGTLWGKNAAEGLSNHTQRLSEDYDRWVAKYLYPLQLQSQIDNYAKEYELSKMRTQDAARVGVAAQKAALEQSGYNPLLAVGDVGGGSIQPLSIPDKSGNFSNSFSAKSVEFADPVSEYYEYKNRLQTLRANDALVKEREANADLARSDADLQMLKNAAERSALEGDHKSAPYDEEISVLTHEGWKQLRDNINERLRKQGYTESEARAWTLDILHETERAVDTFAGAATSAGALKKAFGKRHSIERSTRSGSTITREREDW